MPYMKYGDWYIPGCNIRFPTEHEAMEYMTDHTGNSGQMLLPDLLRMENKTIGYKKGWLI